MNVSSALTNFLKNQILFFKPVFLTNQANYARLAEIGRLKTPQLIGHYKTGQLFLHKLFGYRGVILFPWTARVFDHDLNKRKKICIELEEEEEAVRSMMDDDELKSQAQTFYNVLIDSRDCPYVRAQTETATFIADQDSNRSLFSIPGLDYVAHQDILPYNTSEDQPLHHELLDKFLTFRADQDPPFIPQDNLISWQMNNRPWLELSDVHKETTENIRVTVIPFYMGCRNIRIHWWRYCICLENLGEMSVRLRERHWRIFSLTGMMETVRGRGVVGQQPELSRALPAFQYSSHVSLRAPSGHMWGSFRMEREDGHWFDCRVPPFLLDSKKDLFTSTSPSSPNTHSE